MRRTPTLPVVARDNGKGAGGPISSVCSVRNMLILAFVLYVLTMIVVIADLPLRGARGNGNRPANNNGANNNNDQEAANQQLSMIWDVSEHGKASANEFASPIVVTGTAGTGTRVANDILEHGGEVFMGLRRNPQRDNADFFQIVKPHVDEILRQTKGNIDYKLSDLSASLVDRIRKSVNKFFDKLEADARTKVGAKGRWGFKESQAMFFLPFMYERYPKLRLVQVVRDGRDMAFSKQQRALFQEGYNRIVTGTQASMDTNEYAVAVIQTWQKINLSVMKWLEGNVKGLFIRVRLEDMCGENSEYTAKNLLLKVLGEPDVPDADSTIDKSECRLKKYLTRDTEVIKQLENEGGQALRYFNYELAHPSNEADAEQNALALMKQQNKVDHSVEDSSYEFSRPFVIQGTAGTGTRVGSDIIEHTGRVFMGRDRNKERDNLDFVRMVKPFVEEILKHTNNNLDYEISDLPERTVSRIRDIVDKFGDRMERDAQAQAGRAGRWGWKDSQSMFFLPFLYERWPNLRLIHMVRDGRDMAFSKQQRAQMQERYNRKVSGTTATMDSGDYAKGVIQTWETVNLGVLKYLERMRKPEDFIVVRLEDLCGPDRETFARELASKWIDLSTVDAAKTVELEMCRTKKYESQPAELVRELEQVASAGLRKFHYLTEDIDEAPSGTEDDGEHQEPNEDNDHKVVLEDTTVEGILRGQARKSTSGRKDEVILLVNDKRYKSLLLNWLILANYHGIENYVMISLDQDTHEFCQRLGVASITIEEMLNEPRRDKPISTGELWAKRVAIITKILRLGIGLHLIDADAFMLINPYPIMQPALYDIESLGGDFPWDKVKWDYSRIGTMNGGFLRIASNERTIAFMDEVHQRISAADVKDDQLELNVLLSNEKVEWTKEIGCNASFGICYHGITQPSDKQVRVRILDRPHFPVYATFTRNKCGDKFFLSVGNTNTSDFGVESQQYYYTPPVVHPAGLDKVEKAKKSFFEKHGLSFLKTGWEQEIEHVYSTQTYSYNLDVEYINAITDKSQIKRLSDMNAYFRYKLAHPDITQRVCDLHAGYDT